MKLTIRAQYLKLTDELRQWIERRLYFAFSRYSPRIASISVVIESLRSAGECHDQQCRISVNLHDDELIVETKDADTRAAIAFAVGQASRMVQRELDRQRTRGSETRPSRGNCGEPEALSD